MIDLNYRKDLLNELRLIPYIPGKENTEITEEMAYKAMTLNENLMTLGYTLSPDGILQIAASPSVDTLYDEVKECVGTVDAAPMYPDFPKQVMAMDEFEFRLHQMLHYFSTYGVEECFGVKTLKGWIPDMPETEKTEKDARLLRSKVIGLVDETDPDALYFAPMQKILAKRERMTVPEKEIVKFAAGQVQAGKLQDLQVPFKQNLMDIFHIIMDSLASDDALPALHGICQHTGDVLKCMDYCLTKNKYHFRTSQKKLLVKLLESYPAKDFKANMILSRKKGARSVLLVQYLDYNEYSRSAEHKEAVRELRNGELKSWEAQAKYLVSAGDDGALDYIAKRPGMLLRMTAWLLRLGYGEADIAGRLVTNADALSMETVVTVLTKFGKDGCGSNEKDAVMRIFTDVLKAKLTCLETPLKGKAVYLQMPEYDLMHSELRFNDRSEEGGYIRSGLAYRIPEEVKYLRFFVYWNDRDRVDVDLHASGYKKDGSFLHIGWCADFNGGGVIHSGDITHSDAAEYIDIDLSGIAAEICANIHLYSGKSSFGEIETCFTGMMAVKEIGEDVQLYDPANCFFSHELKGKTKFLNYGCINVTDRFLFCNGTDLGGGPFGEDRRLDVSSFSLGEYLRLLFEAQGCQIVEDTEQADAVLVMGKTSGDKEVSLIDHHFFAE